MNWVALSKVGRGFNGQRFVAVLVGPVGEEKRIPPGHTVIDGVETSRAEALKNAIAYLQDELRQEEGRRIITP